MTVLAQLFLNESAELDFGIEVSGADKNSLNARFIIEGPEFGIICKCMESEGVITASVPKLESILPPGIYTSRLEIVVDGKHFQPLTENIKFNQPVSVTASAAVRQPEEVVKVNTGKIHVRMAEDKVTVKPLNRAEVRNSSFSGYVDKSVITGHNTDTARLAKLREMTEKMQELERKLGKKK
jgi:hypothetical protein